MRLVASWKYTRGRRSRGVFWNTSCLIIPPRNFFCYPFFVCIISFCYILDYTCDCTGLAQSSSRKNISLPPLLTIFVSFIYVFVVAAYFEMELSVEKDREKEKKETKGKRGRASCKNKRILSPAFTRTNKRKATRASLSLQYLKEKIIFWAGKGRW